jgi:hypothetical protein
VGRYNKAVSGKRLDKHVPVKQTTEQRQLLGSRISVIEELDYNNGKFVFTKWSVPRNYKRDKVRALFSGVQSGFRSGVDVVAFCWFLLCGGDYHRNCLIH